MKLNIGDKASIEKQFTENDIITFSNLSLDKNPIHIDKDFASKSIFKKQICHGFLIGSLISAVIANKLPGVGSIYLSQTLNFKKPVYIDDTVEAMVEVTEIILEKKIVKLNTLCFNQNKEIVIEGQAVLKVPELND
jgi:3-hydroxybutyryl-CoA dehydratase